MQQIAILNSNCFPGRSGQTAKWLILHGTGGGTSAQAIANYFLSTQGGNNPVSSHYVIGVDGEVVQCVRETDGAYANGYLSAGHDSWWTTAINPNNQTISIEHCKPSTDNSDALTPGQQQASFALIKDICARNHIPMRPADAQGGITGHYSIDPVNRARCPGTYPWSDLWTFLGGISMTTQVPIGWKDDGNTLTAPNGVAVRTGFRDWVMGQNWEGDNWPLQAEQGLQQLEMGNPGLGGGTWQPFRWKVLEWTQKAGVFEGWCGQEVLALRVAYMNALSQVVQTQTHQPGPQLIDLQQIAQIADKYRT